MLPALVLLVIIFAIPMISLLVISLHESEVGGQPYEPGFSLDSYGRFFDPGNTLYLRIMWRTFRLAIVAAGISLLVGYPVCYMIWRAKGLRKNLLLALVLLPLFSNIIARLYGWQLTFSPAGPINDLLLGLGLIDEARSFNYSFRATTVGITYTAMPYFILILLSALEGIDWSLVEAARSLGASRLRSFFEIVLPLSAPGLATAIAVAYAWGIGAYAEPLILGSPREYSLGYESGRQILVNVNWPFGAVLNFVLVITMLVFVIILTKLLVRRKYMYHEGGAR